MGFPSAAPLFAVEEGTIITMIFVVLGFLGWIMNLLQNKNNPPPPAMGGRPRPPRPKDERIQNEIDIFLQEVGVDKKDRREPRDLVVFEDELEPRTPVRPIREQTPPHPPLVEQQPIFVEPAPVERRGVGTGEFGSEIRGRATSHLDTARLERNAAKRPPRDLGHVQQQLTGVVGEDTARLAAHLAAATSDGINPVAGLLMDPEGVRQAIVINEILSRPRALRK